MFTPEKLRRFKKAYEQAVEDHDGDRHAVFMFDGNEYVLGYAKYLIEYLEVQLA